MVASAARGVISKLWRLPDSRILLIRTILTLAIGVGELCLIAAKPCLMSKSLYDDHCVDSLFSLAVIVLPLKGVITFAVLQYIMMPSVNFAMSAQSSQLLLGRKADESHTLPGKGFLGWAAASSLSVFKGIVKVTAGSQLLLLRQVTITTVATALCFTAADLEIAKSPQYQAYHDKACSEVGDSLWQKEMCWVAWLLKDVIAIIVSNSFLYVSVFTLMMRRELWSSVFLQAVQRMDVRWLQRSLWLHWWFLPLNAMILYVFAINIKIVVRKATGIEMVAFVWVSIAYAVLFLGVVVWVLDLDGLVHEAICRFRRRDDGNLDGNTDVQQIHSLRSRRGTTNKVRPGLSSFPSEFPDLEPGIVNDTVSQTDPSADSGFRHRQVQLLGWLSVLFVLVPVGSWWSLGAVWAARVVALLMVMRAEDKECTFLDLHRTDAAFGLLMDADQLKEAIQAYLESKPCPVRCIRTFRGTYYRMEDTMTVSYRWQEQVSRLCRGVSLNMSRWQLAELAQAIDETKVLYVWIDRIALPQKSCKLQQTLLARMMAIYATSKVTLALRSNEVEGDRYHQRAWTLQEYCNAQSLRIVSQPPEASKQSDEPQPGPGPGHDEVIEQVAWAGPEVASAAAAVAVAEDEEELFPEVRLWHQSRSAVCCPFWLGGLDNSSREQLREASRWLGKLSPRLVCKFQEDKIRALYPMIFNTPCEDQTELAGLLNSLDQGFTCARKQSSWSQTHAMIPLLTHEDAETMRALETANVPAFTSGDSCTSSGVQFDLQPLSSPRVSSE